MLTVLRAAETRRITKHEIKTLASEGLTFAVMAKRLGISESHLRRTVRSTASLQKGYIEGRQLCPVKVRAYVIRDEDELLPLKTIDFSVLAVLEAKGRCRAKDIKLLLNITDHALHPALERLEEHSKVRRIEGLIFTEYEASDDNN